MIFTSHRWGEVANLADRITIFRNGEHVATRDASSTRGEAVTLMTGRTIDRMYPEAPPIPDDAPPVLEVRDLRGERVGGVSFALRRGEILGVGGLAGQGQRDLFMTLFGARSASGGEIARRRPAARASASPADAIRHGIGIALVPEDRKTEGLMLPMSVRDNLTLADPRPRLPLRRSRPAARAGARAARGASACRSRRSRPSVQEVAHALGRQPAEGAHRPLAARRVGRSCSSTTSRAASTSARSTTSTS